MGEGRELSDYIETMFVGIPEQASSMECAYQEAKRAKVGTMISCPTCSKKFKKKSYQQAFCSNKGRGNCKDAYWNIVPMKRRERTMEHLGIDEDDTDWIGEDYY